MVLVARMTDLLCSPSAGRCLEHRPAFIILDFGCAFQSGSHSHSPARRSSLYSVKSACSHSRGGNLAGAPSARLFYSPARDLPRVTSGVRLTKRNAQTGTGSGLACSTAICAVRSGKRREGTRQRASRRPHSIGLHQPTNKLCTHDTNTHEASTSLEARGAGAVSLRYPVLPRPLSLPWFKVNHLSHLNAPLLSQGKRSGEVFRAERKAFHRSGKENGDS